jgi:hypothetical protein
MGFTTTQQSHTLLLLGGAATGKRLKLDICKSAIGFEAPFWLMMTELTFSMLITKTSEKYVRGRWQAILTIAFLIGFAFGVSETGSHVRGQVCSWEDLEHAREQERIPQYHETIHGRETLVCFECSGDQDCYKCDGMKSETVN